MRIRTYFDRYDSDAQIFPVRRDGSIGRHDTPPGHGGSNHDGSLRLSRARGIATPVVAPGRASWLPPSSGFLHVRCWESGTPGATAKMFTNDVLGPKYVGKVFTNYPRPSGRGISFNSCRRAFIAGATAQLAMSGEAEPWIVGTRPAVGPTMTRLGLALALMRRARQHGQICLRRCSPADSASLDCRRLESPPPWGPVVQLVRTRRS